MTPAVPDTVEGLRKALDRANAKLERERGVRREAEAIAERGLLDLYRRERQQSFLETIAAKSNETSSCQEALDLLVEEVCRQLGWACGMSYLMERDGDAVRLLPSASRYAEQGVLPFLSLPDVDVPYPTCLPSRVAATGFPAWVASLRDDPWFSRKDMAERLGLMTGAAFPIMTGDTVVAVVEVFSMQVGEENADAVGVMTQAGAHVARVFERESASRRLLYDATHDALTKLPNRANMLAQVDGALADCALGLRGAVHVAFVDLDRFKYVNDSLGHEAGDAFLVGVSRRLLAATKGPSPGVLGRIGGDEFVVLLDETDDETALARAWGLVESLNEPMEIAGTRLQPSASVGVAPRRDGLDKASDLLRYADAAMYKAKASGRSKAFLFDEDMHQAASARLATERALREAVEEGSFVLHYQPVVSAKTSEAVGYESLVRWLLPDGSLAYPGDFVDIAEESGLIVPLGAWVFTEACRAAVRLNAARHGDPIWISVNVSAKQMQHPGLVDCFWNALADTGCRPSYVRIEVTESSAVKDYAGTSQTLRELAEVGILSMIDDFGTGYSSLSHLHCLPFAAVKVDKAFVADVGGRGSQIVRAIVTMATALGMDVIAEGVEDEATMRALATLECSYLQGYHFSRPVDEDSLTPPRALALVA